MMESCINYSNIKIKVLENNGICPRGLCKGQELSVVAMVPDGICPLSFHTAYPYIFTFLKGGNFGWLKDRPSVIVQCPNPRGAVVMKLKRKSILDKHCDMEVVDIKGKCPFGMEKGKIFNNINRSDYVCWQAFDAIFPYINELSNPNIERKEVLVRASCPGCNISFNSPENNDVMFGITNAPLVVFKL